MLSDKRKKFLEHFPVDRRSTVANKFLEPIRRGSKDPEIILTEITEECRRQGNKAYIIDCISEFIDEAVDYIGYLFDWERLPREEKEYYKELQAKKAIKVHMDKELPTLKQLAYLESLGYDGKTPETKAEASEVVNKIHYLKKQMGRLLRQKRKPQSLFLRLKYSIN